VKRILIAEDDPLSARALADYLSAHGYDTLVARTGQQALERFASDRPDMLLLDVQLPLKNGFEVCFAVRQSKTGRAVPILLMSAVYTDTTHAEPYAVQGLGAQGYLVKPFSMKQVLKRVQDLIGA
jgi:DNA-binding response OmpR family regulator